MAGFSSGRVEASDQTIFASPLLLSIGILAAFLLQQQQLKGMLMFLPAQNNARGSHASSFLDQKQFLKKILAEKGANLS
jgi:hypothetical protein